MSSRFLRLLPLLLIMTLSACHSSPPAWPATRTAEWTTYTRLDVGYTLDVPAVFKPEEVGMDTVFRYHNFPIFRVLLVDETAARKRGLWATSRPVGTARVAGQDAQQYDYNHEDFFTYTHTLAYVLPKGERQLGIEFRTDADTLNPTQQHMLDSFRLN